MMRTNITAILVGFLLMMVAAIFMATTAAVAGLSGFVTAQSGTVEVQRHARGVWTPLRGAGKDPARVLVGDKLRTGANSRVELHWADGTRLALDPNTALTVRKYKYEQKQQTSQTSLFRLDVGRVWARVSHTLSADSRFELETPQAVAGVRGTVFSVTATETDTNVAVFEGKVHVAAQGGQDDDVLAGAQATIVAHGLAQGKLKPDELEAWRTHDILQPSLRFRAPLKGRLRAYAEPGASVTVNGQSVEVGPDGAFSAPVQGTATVVVTDAAGHSRTATWPES